MSKKKDCTGDEGEGSILKVDADIFLLRISNVSYLSLTGWDPTSKGAGHARNS